jgi:hypothetical protein
MLALHFLQTLAGEHVSQFPSKHFSHEIRLSKYPVPHSLTHSDPFNFRPLVHPIQLLLLQALHPAGQSLHSEESGYVPFGQSL